MGGLVVTLILGFVIGPPCLIASLLLRRDVNRAADRAWGPQPVRDIPWGSILGGVAGAVAVGAMFREHRQSEYIGEQINHAQYYAQGQATFGSPDYYRAETEYLNEHLHHGW